LEEEKARFSHAGPREGNACRIDEASLCSIHMKTKASMLQIRNRRVVELAAKLAAVRRSTKTDAVLSALENEFARIDGDKAVAEPAKTLAERIKPIQDRVMSRPPTGLEADKAFYDDLSGDS
jgi:antitoxin VapB